MSKSTFPGILLVFFIFLILKLVGTIDWSWLWVTAPLWGGFLLLVSAAVVIEARKR